MDSKEPVNLAMSIKLTSVLEEMEDKGFDSQMARAQNYTNILNSLQDLSNLDWETTERLLAICLNDLTNDIQYCSSAMIIISLILKNIKEGKCDYPAAKLVDSASIIVKLTKMLLTKPLLWKLSIKTLISYPDDTLIALVSSHSADVIDLIDYLPEVNIKNDVTEWSNRFLCRLLQILPLDKKLVFVKDGLNAWFNTLIPAAMMADTWHSPEAMHQAILALQLLTEPLKQINYTENDKWKNILTEICEMKRYPMILKYSLQAGTDYWHILWKIFITLLKDQITKVNKSGVSPINALLPVVELAFKMDSKCRCRAFECWTVLIDNFSTELNESLINKRLKLLMIPLKLNNAKVEETVLSKLDTWWHLIRRFRGKIDMMVDTVLIPFLHFCFGKPVTVTESNVGKNNVAICQISEVVKKKCIEVLVEVVGHVDCDGCCSLPNVEGRLITTKLLVEHWTLWVHCLQSALKTAGVSSCDALPKQVTCLWKGFIGVIAELPENQIKADLFIELLKCVESLLQICKTHGNMAEIIFNILIGSLLVEDPKIRSLLKSKNGTGPLHIILRIVRNLSLNNFFERFEGSFEAGVARFKPLASVLVDPALCEGGALLGVWLVPHAALAPAPAAPAPPLPAALWAALADALYAAHHYWGDHLIFVTRAVLWPLVTSSTDITENFEEMSYRWYTLYSYIQSIVIIPLLDKEIEATLSGKNSYKLADPRFRLCATVAMLKQSLTAEKKALIEKRAQMLFDALQGAQNLKSLSITNKYFPILVDTLNLLMNKVNGSGKKDLAEITIKILQIIFNYVNVSLKNNPDYEKPIFVDKFQSSSNKFLEKLSKNETYASLKLEIDNVFKNIAEYDHTVNSKSNTNLVIIPDNNVNESDSTTKLTEQKQNSEKNFTTPKPKTAKKKKDLNIVNTVVENGEEFVVVKSHWKFNPKKLTENQKDKFKRKREDIPALYQDLSQSQDEFKLTTWKTDSQDTTTSSNSKSESNSKSNDNVASILQKLPSTEFVPQIIENIFADTANKNENVTHINNNDINNGLPQTPMIKKPKTPRLALKDRVFKNVRNLIEKSGLQGDDTNKVEDMNRTVSENILTTPVSKVIAVTSLATHSAPTKLLSDRPARSIRKPKKFDDTEMFALKKKQRSLSMSQPDSPQYSETSDMGEEVVKEHISDTKQNDENKINDIVNSDSTEQQKETYNEDRSRPSDVETGDDEAPSQIEHPQSPTLGIQKVIQQTNVIEKENDKMEIDDQPINDKKNNSSQIIEKMLTPRPEKVKKNVDEPTTIKRRRSRIEKELLIDMVEGHPILQQSQSQKRVTRKNMAKDETNDTVIKRRKSLMEKSNKIKTELVHAWIVKGQTKEKNKPNSKSSSPKGQQDIQTVTAGKKPNEEQSHTVNIIDSQDQSSGSQEDIPMSEDVIESSQDSTITTISVNSSSKKRVALVSLDRENALCKNNKTEAKKLITEFSDEVIPLSDTSSDSCNQDSKDDIELPKNKTMPEESAEVDLTENMDTEPMDSSGEVIIIDDEVATPIVLNTEETVIGKGTQETAEADTLPIDNESLSVPPTSVGANDTATIMTIEAKTTQTNINITHVPSQEEITPTISGTAEVITDLIVESSNTDSPLKDEIQRKKDFLNNTIEISPIKTLSPVREKKSPSPDRDHDFVVIKLTSPVQSNGEPFNEKCDSPEVFTEDKVSPDKRDQSPPRKEAPATNSSPSSSLSLKKNRPQMRFNGRAAQMLGLCVPENLQILNTERSENDEGRKTSPVCTPARRNLKKFYNGGEGNDSQANENESEDVESFLKFTRPLPKAESSPANPILKRKLIEIADESTVSPASKRKRVSFHDPPVSTTVAVQKYIEPCGARSPSDSIIKRQERQIRALTYSKSPKRLENVFRLETVLSKAVESFSDDNTISSDTEMSLDETPVAEVVKTSELNDTDPICPELLDCKDPIENIASDLSSPSTKVLLIKELEGKVETVADLAKMTELEVNRLCIKAPKIKVAKKVLIKYAERTKIQEIPELLAPEEVPNRVVEIERVDIEVQTNDVLTKNSEMQTIEVPKVLVHTQTEAVPTTHSGAQTNETGSKSTKDIITMCFSERPDFVDHLTQQLQNASVRQISEKLPFDDCLSLVLKKMTASNSCEVLNQVICQTAKYTTKESMDLNILQDYLCKRFDSKDLILFCSQLLQKIHDKHS